jgi:hypothetical protein
MGQKLSRFISELSNYRFTTERYPASMHAMIDEAVALKRIGLYEKSADIYIGLTKASRTVYSGIIMYLYKVVASAGYLAEGLFLLELGKDMYDSDPSPLHIAAGIPSNFDVHIHKLLTACRSESGLFTYLQSISGNPRFILERDYLQMLEELADYVDQAQR